LLVPLWSLSGALLAFTLKHFVADFLAQTNWIARGKESRRGWFYPLAVHVLIHAALTLVIVGAFAPRLWWLALADLAVHASIDRGKSRLLQWGGWDTSRAQFWWLLGFDQYLHQVTNIALAVALVTL